MSFQLIFTSAPRGLTLGRSGFCTVARHKDISESLVTALERLSAYERSENSRDNLPIVQAYRILRLGSATYHVLTRIQDSGVDYTQRGNHLAQHLIFLPGELSETPTPADVFLNWTGWLETWTENPHYLDSSHQPPLSTIPQSLGLPAQTWQGRTGDAAHAVHLAEAGMRPGAILTASSLPSDQALHLLGESLLLVETDESGVPGSWSVPFTTLLQAHDLEEDFFWRCEETPDPETIQSRNGFPVLSLDTAIWPPLTNSLLVKRAREGGVSVPKLKDTARLPDLRRPEENLEIERKPLRRSPSSFSPAPTSPSKNTGTFFAGAGLVMVMVLAVAWFLTRSSAPSANPSFLEKIAHLQVPGQRETLRQFLRENPASTGNPETDSALEKAALWLEASDCLDQLQFLRRQDQVASLEEALARTQNLPQIAELKQALPQLGYEIDEAKAWLAQKNPPTVPPDPASVPSPRPASPPSEKTTDTLARLFGSQPAILTVLSPDKTLGFSHLPDATAWFSEKNPDRLVRILPLDRLPVSGEGTIAKPQPRRNRSDPIRFYQGVHLLFEARVIEDVDGTESFELGFSKDFDLSAPAGTFGRIFQFENASGALFSIVVLKQEETGPLLRLPRSMIELDPGTPNYGLRKEFFRDTKVTLAGPATAVLESPEEKKPAGGIFLNDAGSWEKLLVPASKNLPALGLYLNFPESEEGKNSFLLFLFEGEPEP